MKTLGIIGGIGPESTIEYYRSIVNQYRERKNDGHYPSVVINSIDLTKALDLLAAGQLAALADFLLVEIEKLAQAGATIGLLAANTPHIVFDEVQRRSTLPLISIVKATCDAAKKLGLQRVGLFGTRYTMQAGFYQEVFSQQGMIIIVPTEDEQTVIHSRYLNELVKGILLPQTRECLLAIANKMKEHDRIEGLILGGTELPLILKAGHLPDLPLLDTTQIHVEAALEWMMA
jgi:aspartate racemase